MLYPDYAITWIKRTRKYTLLTYTTLFRSITGIKPGAFKVREVAQSGWTCSAPNAGPADADADGVVTSSDRKSTRLNSSHVKISYAVFCVKKTPTTTSAMKHKLEAHRA